MDTAVQTNYPIHELLQKRWSPRAFSTQSVEPEKLLSLFEAARWSASGFNLQPWSFLVVTRQNPEPFDKLVAVLSEGNQLWAKNVQVLVLALARREREPGKPNPWAAYDLGQSIAHLSIQASALGLQVHQMGGFDPQKAVNAFDIPEEFQAITVVAIGYAGDPNQLPDNLRERELQTRTRKPLSEIVFENRWNQPLEKIQAMVEA
ncbi:MAG: nitroreductase family protein [Chloroflexota bacterium]